MIKINKRKIISFICLLSFSLGLFSASVFAENEAREVIGNNDEIKYYYKVLDDNTIKITKAEMEADGDPIPAVYIPSTIDGYTVSKIGRKVFAGNKRLDFVQIPDTVTEIHASAFGESSLKRVRLSSKITKIGARAFFSTNLNSIHLPKGLKYVGESAFSQTYIKKIVVPSSLKKIENYAFKTNKAKIYSVSLPKKMQKIGAAAFKSNMEKTLIIGYKGSLAESLAEKFNYRFKDVVTKKITEPINYKKLVAKSAKTKLKSVISDKTGEILVSWGQMTYVDSMEGVLKYKIQVSKFLDFTNAKKYESKHLSKRIKGLESGTAYYVRVRGVAKIRKKWFWGDEYSYAKNFNGRWSEKILVKVA